MIRHFLVVRKAKGKLVERFVVCNQAGFSTYLNIGDVIRDSQMKPNRIPVHIPYRPSKYQIHIEED